MKPYTKYWWRITGGCLLGLLVLVAPTFVALSLLRDIRPLVTVPAHWAVLYQVQLDETAGDPGEVCRDTIGILRERTASRRFGALAWRMVGTDRIEVRAAVRDPSELNRLVVRRGELTFRILAGDRGIPVDGNALQSYVSTLHDVGPEQVRRKSMPFAWFPIRRNDPNGLPNAVTEQHAGRWYVLLCNRPPHQMLHGRDGGAWRVTEAFRDTDQYNRPAIGFLFDEGGARRLYDLTSTHKGKGLAILLDDEVFSAPTVESAISDRGQITGRFTRREVGELISVLRTEALPVRIAPRPLSVRKRPATDPPHALLKRALLVGLGVLWACAAAMGFRAVARAQTGAFGLWALATAAAGQAWWQVVAWNNFIWADWPRRALFVGAAFLIPLIVVWVIALVMAQRQSVPARR